MFLPWTLMPTGASGDVAGPLTTEPLVMLNLLPWQGQLIVPPVTLSTRQPRCVHTALNAANVPDLGCVTTIFWSASTSPPPTGTFDVVVSAGAPLPPPPFPPPPPLPPPPPPPPSPELVLAGGGALPLLEL